MDTQPQTAIVIGARNLGAEIARDLLSRGVKVASVARTEADLERLLEDGAVPVPGDAADPDDLARVFGAARERNPCRAADRGRDHRLTQDCGDDGGSRSGLARSPGRRRARRLLPRLARATRVHARARDHRSG